MEENRKKSVVRVYVTEEMKEYLEEQSNEFSMSISGYVNMCIAQCKQQTQAIMEMSKIQDYLLQLQELEQKRAIVSKGMKDKIR